MARVDVCTSCGKPKTIRRSSGKCDTCYMREDYMADPGNRAKASVRSRAWKRANREHLAAYMRQKRAQER